MSVLREESTVMAKTLMSTKRRYDIDCLKAIAIIAIVLYHLFDLLNYLHLSELKIFSGGFVGVDVFFVIMFLEFNQLRNRVQAAAARG